MENEIIRDGFRVRWSSGISRWQKYGHDRLYFPGRGRNYIDLNNLAEEFEAEWTNPYGLDTKRITNASGIIGRRHEVRHDGRVEFVEVVKL